MVEEDRSQETVEQLDETPAAEGSQYPTAERVAPCECPDVCECGCGETGTIRLSPKAPYQPVQFTEEQINAAVDAVVKPRMTGEQVKAMQREERRQTRLKTRRY